MNFAFDSRNRLIQAGSTTYRYDAENQRIGVNQTQFVVNSQPALSQVLVKEENGVKTFYVYGLGLIGEETGSKYTNYHFDLRGSTVALTNSTGQVTEKFQYSPYGVLLSGDVEKTPFLFNGMYGVMTDSNGLYYMRARFYNPEMRRFVNQDILLGNIDDGQTLNRYAYVTGRPVSFVDPFGLQTVGLDKTEWLDSFILGIIYGGTGEPIELFSFLELCSCGNPNDVIENARLDSRKWGYSADRTDVHILFDVGTYKCNLFVDTVYENSGYSLPNIGGSWLSRLFGIFPPGARSAADPNYDIPGWPVVFEPAPGDLAAEGRHVGIVVTMGLTISASPAGVIENDWGFRPNQKGKTVFRRCSCQ